MPGKICQRPRLQASRAHGFTLVELVLVIVLLGILAVVAIPRLNTGSFEAYGYSEEIRSALRYARQTAVARNTSVTVVVESGGYRICVADTCPVSGGAYLSNPGNGRPWDGSARGRGEPPSGVVPSAAAIRFDGLGRPGEAANILIGDLSIAVEDETGYVY